MAEGIECAEALERARQLGCDLAQGFHIGRQLPPAELRGVLDAPPPG